MGIEMLRSDLNTLHVIIKDHWISNYVSMKKFPNNSAISSTFLCRPGACLISIDPQIFSICLSGPSTFHCQLIMMALTSKPCQMDLRYEKGNLALNVPHRSR
jgi:hypothetical protein